MYNSSLKPVLLVVGVGIILFAMPFFILKVVLFFLLFGALFRFVGRRLFWSRFARVASVRNGYYPGRYNRYEYKPTLHPVLADTVRNMTNEEYDSFRQKLDDDQAGMPNTEQKTTIEIQ